MMMDLKKDLPKLGKETVRGVYYEVDGTSINIGRRPNYADFRNNKYNDEENCVSVLLGITKPNALLLSFIRRLNSLSFNDRENDLSYGLYLHLSRLFQSIRKNIDIGIATGDIGKVSEIKENDVQAMSKLCSSVMNSETDVEFAYSSLNCEFLSSRYYDTIYFLSWMQENGYPIPEELAIEKNGNGEPVWADRSNKTKKTITIPVPTGTKWFQIQFRLVNPNRFEITTPDGMEPYNPDDLGFTPKIRDLIERFASVTEHTPGSLNGRAGKIHRYEAPEYIKAEKSDISRLRRLLQLVFPEIEGDPIPYVKPKGYRAEFHITEA